MGNILLWVQTPHEAHNFHGNIICMTTFWYYIDTVVISVLDPLSARRVSVRKNVILAFMSLFKADNVSIQMPQILMLTDGASIT